MGKKPNTSGVYLGWSLEARAHEFESAKRAGRAAAGDQMLQRFWGEPNLIIFLREGAMGYLGVENVVFRSNGVDVSRDNWGGIEIGSKICS